MELDTDRYYKTSHFFPFPSHTLLSNSTTWCMAWQCTPMHNVSAGKRITASKNSLAPTHWSATEDLLQRAGLTLHPRIWHQLRHKHTWPLSGLLTRVLAPSLKFLPWEACDPSKVPKRCKTERNCLARSQKRPVGATEMGILWWGEHS